MAEIEVYSNPFEPDLAHTSVGNVERIRKIHDVKITVPIPEERLLLCFSTYASQF